MIQELTVCREYFFPLSLRLQVTGVSSAQDQKPKLKLLKQHPLSFGLQPHHLSQEYILLVHVCFNKNNVEPLSKAAKYT